ncbi:MAG: hypothetical protein IJX21_02620, partial [Alistipes sp.]|nr:hypothetical protein [Alistipes sp.]
MLHNLVIGMGIHSHTTLRLRRHTLCLGHETTAISLAHMFFGHSHTMHHGVVALRGEPLSVRNLGV